MNFNELKEKCKKQLERMNDVDVKKRLIVRTNLTQIIKRIDEIGRYHGTINRYTNEINEYTDTLEKKYKIKLIEEKEETLDESVRTIV